MKVEVLHNRPCCAQQPSGSIHILINVMMEQQSSRSYLMMGKLQWHMEGEMQVFSKFPVSWASLRQLRGLD